MSTITISRIIEKLRPYGACDVADALSRLKHPAGGFLPGLVMYSPNHQTGSSKIIGPVHTVQFERNSEKGSKPEIEGHYIDKTPSSSILFLNAPPGIPNAVYGGIMSARLQKLGAVGAIVSGRLRDINEQRELQWPVWARGIGTTAGAEVCFPSRMDVPISVKSWTDGVEHEARVEPGDIIVADADGVVSIPSRLAEMVTEIIEVVAEADGKCLADVKAGRSVEEAFTEHRGKLTC